MGPGALFLQEQGACRGCRWRWRWMHRRGQEEGAGKGRARSTSLREICKERRRDEAVCEQGICQTAIKKVCRRLGIMKWPYKEMRTPPERAQDKGDYKGEAADNSDAARYCAVRYL